MGDLSRTGVHCEFKEPKFIEEFTMMGFLLPYLAISEDTATCMAEVISRSPIGKFELDDHTLNALLEVEGVRIINTKSLKPKIPILTEKIGYDVPLLLELGYKDMEVHFGTYGSNVALAFTLTVSVFTDSHEATFWQGHIGKEEIMYDEYGIQFAFDVDVKDALSFVKINQLNLMLNQYGTRSHPLHSTFDISENEYLDYLSDLQLTLHELKEDLNETILRKGIKTPYRSPDLYTSAKFMPHTMYMILFAE